MKKALLIFVTALALLAILVIPVIAGGPKADKGDRGRSGKAGKPNVGAVHLGSTDDDDGGPPEDKGWRRGQAGNSNVAHLYLYEKETSDWSIVGGGAWGKMKYNASGQEFKSGLNAHGLEPGTEYTLIYYPDPWPGEGLICLGTGTANNGGNVHIKKSVDTGDLPVEGDLNADPDTTTLPDNKTGAKIWLVLSSDVDCGDEDGAKMDGWHPTEYLLEYDLITFDAD